MKRQSQDKPQVKIRVQSRRARLTKLFAEGKTVRQAQKIINAEGHKASRALVGFDLQALAKEAPIKVARAREEAGEQLRGLRQIIANAEELGLKDQVNLLLDVHDRYARLLGLDAPSKSVQAVVSPDGAAFEFLRHSHGLSDDQLTKVYTYMDTLEREKPVIDASYFPPEEPNELT
jgi:hypothetical protein